MDSITLKFDSKQMDIIANALGQRPYIEVAQLLQNISQQVQAQQQPPQLPQPPVDPAGRPVLEVVKPNGAAHQEAP